MRRLDWLKRARKTADADLEKPRYIPQTGKADYSWLYDRLKATRCDISPSRRVMRAAFFEDQP